MQILLQLAGSDLKSGNVSSLEVESEAGTETVPNFSLDSGSGSEAFGAKDAEEIPALSKTVDFKLNTLTTFKDTPFSDAEIAFEPSSLEGPPAQGQTDTYLDPVSVVFEASIPKGNVLSVALDTKLQPSDKQITAREFAVTDVSSHLVKAKGFDEVQGRAIPQAESQPRAKPFAIGEEAESNAKILVSNEKVTAQGPGEISGIKPVKTPSAKPSPSPAYSDNATEPARKVENDTNVKTVVRETNAKSSTSISGGASLAESELSPSSPQRTEGLNPRDKVQESDRVTHQLERATQTLLDRNTFRRPISSDKAALKQTPVEIRFNPNSAEANQTDQQEVNLAERRTALSRPELVSQQKSLVEPVAIQKPDAKRQDSKTTLAHGQRAVIEPDGQTAVPELAKQTNQVSQANAQQTPLVHSTPLSTIETLQFTDGPQARDTGIHISGESPEIRKDSTTPSKIEALARPVVHQLAQAAKTMSDGSIEVRLAPEELGRVRLSLNPGETNITVHISAERQETMDLIRRNLELFSQSLKQEGFSNLSFSFEGSGNEQADRNEEAPDIILSDEDQIDDDASNPPHRSRAPASGQLDIRI